MATISIIVPIYNVEAYLPRCLDSLIGQTYRDIEIICVNDGSSDGCAIILEEYTQRDSRIRVITQANGGISSARNSGLAAVKSEFLMFCDPDDEFMPDMCERMYDAIIKGNADVAVCGTHVIRENILHDKIVNDEYFSLGGLCGVQDMTDTLRRRTNVCLWCKIWRMDIIRKYNLRFPVGIVHEDITFWWEYSFYTKRVAFVTDKLYRYILRSTSIMGTESMMRRSAIDSLKAFRYIVDYAIANDLFDRYANVMLQEYASLLFDTYNKLKPIGLNEFYEESQLFLNELDYRKFGLPLSVRHAFDSVMQSKYLFYGTRRRKILGITVKKETHKPTGYCLRIMGCPIAWKRYR